MVAVPAVAMSVAGIVALKTGVAPGRKAVVRVRPFQCTTDPLKKPVPLTVRLKAGPPAVAETGSKPVI
jgi:hypothetical protein